MRLGISDDRSQNDKLRKLCGHRKKMFCKAKTVAGFMQLDHLLLMHDHEVPCVHRQFENQYRE